MDHAIEFHGGCLALRSPNGQAILQLPVLPMRLHFRNACFDQFEISAELQEGDSRILHGKVAGTAMLFEGKWWSDPDGWFRFSVRFSGVPEEAWGPFAQLTLLDVDAGETGLEADLGWREYQFTADDLALGKRPVEEGGGLQPPNGYPVFGRNFFLGIEHPMSCVEQSGSRVRLHHHPLWKGGELVSAQLVIGICREGETTANAFGRYFATIRRAKPERAIVEINTFWTDLRDEAGYRTDLASYRAMAESWSKEVLQGESGLVSHFLLDAGWQEIASLYRPQTSNGGPSDGALGALGEEIKALGFEFGLWMSLNGPIGTDIDWAERAGYRVNNQGCGAGYSSMGGKIRYICLTDERWEEDLSRRFEEVIDNTPVSFFKGDWDNDAIEDPTRFPGDQFSRDQLREAIADAMIRIYGRMHARRPELRLRGAWWPSPWWFSHVDTTHLPNSGDMEASGFPSLSQRDAGHTCRDAVYHQVMSKSRTPVSFDVICGHEFASSRRNPVQDTEESWMNNLALWVSRGSNYFQLYLAPYGLHGWKSWSIREILRWFRANEALLWKGETRMVGGDPLQGGVYGYYHRSEGRELLTLRNPLARPQQFPDLNNLGVAVEGWSELYPFYRRLDRGDTLMASHEVVILVRGGDAAPEGVLLNTAEGLRTLASSRQPIPELHRLGPIRGSLEKPSEQKLAIHVSLPYELNSAEVVLQVRIREPQQAALRVAVGRYPDEVATFPVGLTMSRSTPQMGYAMTRLKADLPDPEVAILRFPIGVGGDVYAFLSADSTLPEIEGAWIEGTPSTESVPESLALPLEPLPPSSSSPRQGLFSFNLVA